MANSSKNAVATSNVDHYFHINPIRQLRWELKELKDRYLTGLLVVLIRKVSPQEVISKTLDTIRALSVRAEALAKKREFVICPLVLYAFSKLCEAINRNEESMHEINFVFDSLFMQLMHWGRLWDAYMRRVRTETADYYPDPEDGEATVVDARRSAGKAARRL
jgi:hypothetical protein